MGLNYVDIHLCYRHCVPTGLKDSRTQGINGMNALGHSPGMNDI